MRYLHVAESFRQSYDTHLSEWSFDHLFLITEKLKHHLTIFYPVFKFINDIVNI